MPCRFFINHHSNSLNRYTRYLQNLSGEGDKGVRDAAGVVEAAQVRDHIELPLWLNKKGKLVIKVSALQRKKERLSRHACPDVKIGRPPKRKKRTLGETGDSDIDGRYFSKMPSRRHGAQISDKRRKTNHRTTGFHNFRYPERSGVVSIPATVPQELEFNHVISSLSGLALSSSYA